MSLPDYVLSMSADLNLSMQDHYLWIKVKRTQQDLRYVDLWNSTCLGKCMIQKWLLLPSLYRSLTGRLHLLDYFRGLKFCCIQSPYVSETCQFLERHLLATNLKEFDPARRCQILHYNGCKHWILHSAAGIRKPKSYRVISTLRQGSLQENTDENINRARRIPSLYDEDTSRLWLCDYFYR